jgi:signal transduction histidine kinase
VRDVQVVADRRPILQVLANLLGNAIKFSVPGGTVVFRADADQAEARIVISDTGPGIPQDELETVFEPYRTIRRTGTAGTGLGLYIAKGIVQRHGGRIQVESQVGTGSMFSFTVPRAVETPRCRI